MVEIPPFLRVVKEYDNALYDRIVEIREFAYKDGVLPTKIKLLMVMLCDACYGSKVGCAKISDHARRAGATDEEILETIRIAAVMGGLNGLSAGLGGYEGYTE